MDRYKSRNNQLKSVERLEIVVERQEIIGEITEDIEK
jgi:hypothetical protein